MSLTLDEIDQFQELLGPVSEIKSELSDYERRFVTDLEEKFDEHGADIFMSPSMWSFLRALHARA